MSRKTQHTTYAIVDIETTGGYAAGSGITEIAVLIHDGTQVIHRYETLVNPGRPIPLSIQAMTGITPGMVADSPAFEEIAQEIFGLLEGKVFVAHNVNFDYSFIRHHLEAAGYAWKPAKLCTVRLARRIRPGLPSYSLGRLCDALGIPIRNRHRAMGDAEATAILFSRLLEWDAEGIREKMLKKTSPDQRLPPNLPPEHFEALPHAPGVYYFRDGAGKVIYVGKAADLRKRVAAHFTGHNPNPQRQHFLRHIHAVDYEVCATELMAFLLECIEIRRLWPFYNRALKRFEPKYGLLMYEDRAGYKRLAVGRLGRTQPCVHVCHREFEGVQLLRRLAEDFRLDTRLCHFGKRLPAPPGVTDPAPLPAAGDHNARVEEALAHLAADQPTFAILDKGRTADEKSCIWIERGQFHAMGYIAADTDLRTPGDIRDSLPRYQGNHYMMQLIRACAEQYPHKVLRC